MSSFKEMKKRDKIKTWECKIRRLYASEQLSEDDLKYLNIQYDLYKLRKTNSYIWAFSGFGLIYIFPMIDSIHWSKRILISLLAGAYVYSKVRTKNRQHYENIIMPYFEKYFIK
jgi:hypothetical protein